MVDEITTVPQKEDTVSFIPLGGIEDVTRNMYLYIYKDQILIVDCGLGFPDETMLGVDLLLPDISYLLNTTKKIVGMVLTHGHEDHIGGLPFILPQLPSFPIYASPLTAALANEKLIEFSLAPSVQTVPFDSGDIKIGDFTTSFLRVTHSVPDSANIVIKTPVGNLFHGSDFKFDLTPADGKRTEFSKILKASEEQVLCLMSDCLGSERSGFTPSEEMLEQNFEREMRECKGKFIITTYSSNVSRLNQAIQVAQRLNRKVCFVGRSLVKVKLIGQKMGYLALNKGTEVAIDELYKYKDNQLLLLVAGSQGQENSAMSRIAEGEHKEIKLTPQDVVVFSSDPIPGNEVAINALVDTISKRGARVVSSANSHEIFHVSGHGSSGDHMLLIALTKPRFMVPISGTYRQMVNYRDLTQKMGYKRSDLFLIENGQEVVFGKNSMKLGNLIDIKNVYVDEMSGEELENFVIRDREKLGKEGIVIVMAEINASNGRLASKPEFIMRGFVLQDDKLSSSLMKEMEKSFANYKGRVSNWPHMRKLVGDTTERFLYKRYHRRPLVIPVIIEV